VFKIVRRALLLRVEKIPPLPPLPPPEPILFSKLAENQETLFNVVCYISTQELLPPLYLYNIQCLFAAGGDTVDYSGDIDL
jgi:hypothetical protein